MSAGQSLEFAALVLFLLMVFGTFGSGHYSLDHVLDAGEPQKTDAHTELADDHSMASRRAH